MAANRKGVDYWEKRTAETTWKIYNSLEEKNRDLLDFYIDASKNVKEEIYSLAERYSRDGVLSLSDIHKNNHLKRLNKKYEKIIEQLTRQVEAQAEKNMEGGFSEVYGHVSQAVGNLEFAIPEKKLMEKLLNEPWRSGSFSGRLWKNQKKLVSGLNELLLTGLQQGKTATEIAVNLHNLMGNSFNDCHRLVRTETMHYLNEAAKKGYMDAGVKKVQFWAAVDERTCEVCGAMHGKVYPVRRAPVLPLHPNCRCTWLPVLEEDIKEATSTPLADYRIRNHKPGIKTIKERLVINEAISSVPAKVRQALENGTIIDVGKDGGSQYDYAHDIMYIAKGADKKEVIHEIGHLVENKMLDEGKVAEIRKRFVGSPTTKGIKKDIYYDAGNNPMEIYLLDNENFISEYQGRIYVDTALEAFDTEGNFKDELLWEFISESFREYVEDSEGLKEKSRELYNLIREAVE